MGILSMGVMWAMPARPSRPAPRMRRRRTVSAWSSAWWAKRIASHFFWVAILLSAAKPRVAGSGFRWQRGRGGVFFQSMGGEGLGEGFDEAGVGGARFAADAVVDVSDVERPLPMLGLVDGVEETEQGDVSRLPPLTARRRLGARREGGVRCGAGEWSSCWMRPRGGGMRGNRNGAQGNMGSASV